MRGRTMASLAVLVVGSLVAASTGVAALTTNTSIPSSFTFFDQCSGENVAVSGDVHLVSTATVTANTISGTFHSDFHAVGLGQASGLAYEENVVANSSFQTSLINGEATQTFVGRINVVAPGGGNNQSSPIFMHTTMNADGDITSLKVEAPTVICT